MQLCCTKSGILVFQLWAALVLTVPCLALFWQMWWLCLAVWLVSSAIAAFFVRRWLSRISLRLIDYQLRLKTGSMLRVSRRQPVWSVCSVRIVQTPLMKYTSTCLLVLYSSHSVWVVPAVSLEQAEKLSLIVGNGGGYR